MRALVLRVALSCLSAVLYATGQAQLPTGRPPGAGLELGGNGARPRRWVPPSGGCQMTVNVSGGGGAGGGYSTSATNIAKGRGGPGASFIVSFFLPAEASLLAWSAAPAPPPVGTFPSTTNAQAGAGGGASA